MNHLGEIGFEFRKDVIVDVLPDQTEGFHDDQSLNLRNPRFGIGDLVESYLGDHLRIHVHVRECIEGVQDELRNYCALFYPLQPTRLNHSQSGGDHRTESEAATSSPQKNDGKHPVFAHIVKLGQQPERVGLGIVPSLVWLQLLHDCSVFCQSLSPSLETLTFAPRRDAFKNWKQRLATAGHIAIEFDQLPHQMIQSAAHFMRCSANQETPLDAWDGFDIAKFERAFFAVTVHIKRDCVRVTCEKGGNTLLQLMNVIIRPREFRAHTSQEIAHDC